MARGRCLVHCTASAHRGVEAGQSGFDGGGSSRYLGVDNRHAYARNYVLQQLVGSACDVKGRAYHRRWTGFASAVPTRLVDRGQCGGSSRPF
jgi:hypothetical protein